MRWLFHGRRGRKIIGGGILLGSAVVLSVIQPVSFIAPNELGLRTNLVNGRITELREGWALMIPHVHSLHRYPLRDQLYRTERNAQANGPAPFQSAEGLSIGVDVAVRYALDPDRVMALEQKLPADIGREIVEPVIDGVLRRIFAQNTVREIFSTKRAEIQRLLAAELTPVLELDGVRVRSVTLGNVDLPAQYRSGLESLLAEELNAEKMRFTLELKDKQIAQAGLEGEAEKIKREKAAEAAGSEEIIAAKAKAEAMRHILPFKEKEIEERRLEAEAAKIARITQATGEAEAHRIEAGGEADARRKLADSDAYRLEVTGKATSEQMSREADLLTRNPLLIQKALADKLSDKIQVIIAPPQAGGFFASGLLGPLATAHRESGPSAPQAQAPSDAAP